MANGDRVEAGIPLRAETIAETVDEAERQGIRGKAITPFLLAKIENLTGERSLETNIELVLNNARLGGEVAVAFHLKQQA